MRGPYDEAVGVSSSSVVIPTGVPCCSGRSGGIRRPPQADSSSRRSHSLFRDSGDLSPGQPPPAKATGPRGSARQHVVEPGTTAVPALPEEVGRRLEEQRPKKRWFWWEEYGEGCEIVRASTGGEAWGKSTACYVILPGCDGEPKYDWRERRVMPREGLFCPKEAWPWEPESWDPIVNGCSKEDP